MLRKEYILKKKQFLLFYIFNFTQSLRTKMKTSELSSSNVKRIYERSARCFNCLHLTHEHTIKNEKWFLSQFNSGNSAGKWWHKHTLCYYIKYALFNFGVYWAIQSKTLNLNIFCCMPLKLWLVLRKYF